MNEWYGLNAILLDSFIQNSSDMICLIFRTSWLSSVVSWCLSVVWGSSGRPWDKWEGNTSLTTVCPVPLLHIITYRYPVYVVTQHTCNYMWLPVIKCNYMLLRVVICNYVGLLVITCNNMWLPVITCNYMWLHVITYGYL